MLVFHLSTNLCTHHLNGPHEFWFLLGALHMHHPMMHIPDIGDHCYGHAR